MFKMGSMREVKKMHDTFIPFKSFLLFTFISGTGNCQYFDLRRRQWEFLIDFKQKCDICNKFTKYLYCLCNRCDPISIRLGIWTLSVNRFYLCSNLRTLRISHRGQTFVQCRGIRVCNGRPGIRFPGLCW